MVQATCQEISGLSCPAVISGNDRQEFRHNAYEHGREQHAGMLRKISRRDQAAMDRRMEEVWERKSAGVSSR